MKYHRSVRMEDEKVLKEITETYSDTIKAVNAQKDFDKKERKIGVR